MPTIGPPPNPGSPLFVYGSLKPGELAHSLIASYVSRTIPVEVPGCLRLRDGLPLFNPEGAGRVSGYALQFDPTTNAKAWKAVEDFEPGTQYEYESVDLGLAGEHVRANILVGLQLDRGTSSETVDCWSAASDPSFVEGLQQVFALTTEIAPHGVVSQSDSPNYWRQFFRLQAIYLLLWSILERYTALRYGPGLDPGKRIAKLNIDPAFQKAVTEAGARPDVVYESRDPSEKATLQSGGTGAGRYFYRVRSNLSHRGKSAFRDGRLVFKALVELHDAVRIMLARQLPLEDAWKRHEPGGWLLRDRIPGDAIVPR